MTEQSSPASLVSQWLQDFGAALERGDLDAVSDLFAEECYWRDLLSFTWNIKTLEGKQQITAMLASVLAGAGARNWTPDQGSAKADGDITEAFFGFETASSRGIGHLRLREGKCWTLLTTMTELKGFEERKGVNRDLGVEHRARRDLRNRPVKQSSHLFDRFLMKIRIARM